MSIEIAWLVPYRVIEARLRGTISIEEVDAMSKNFTDLLGEAQTQVPGRTIYLLYDTIEAESLPPVYRMMKQALPVLKFTNRGPMFHVTQNKVIRSIIDLAANITRFEVFAFASREDAIHAIEARMAHDDLAATQ